jgi:hypothetical protein
MTKFTTKVPSSGARGQKEIIVTKKRVAYTLNNKKKKRFSRKECTGQESSRK